MAKPKSKSTVNKAGNYTKPALRKRIFNRIKAGGKGGSPGQWSARKAQMVAKAYKKAGGGYRSWYGRDMGNDCTSMALSLWIRNSSYCIS